MTWSWPHTAEGEHAVRENIHALPRNVLVEVYAEWQAFHVAREEEPDAHEPFCVDTFHRTERNMQNKAIFLANDTLADYIFEQASGEDHGRTCSNGGHNAWICKYGCHTVPFSITEEQLA